MIFCLHSLSTMELKASSLLLLMCVSIIILTEAGTNALPRCCLDISRGIPRDMLSRVRKYEIQSRSGRCEIDALILHIGNKKICAHPKLRKLLDKIKKYRKPKQA